MNSVNNIVFHSMFYGCENFNQDISLWDLSNGEDFKYMLMDTDVPDKVIIKLLMKANTTYKELKGLS